MTNRKLGRGGVPLSVVSTRFAQSVYPLGGLSTRRALFGRPGGSELLFQCSAVALCNHEHPVNASVSHKGDAGAVYLTFSMLSRALTFACRSLAFVSFILTVLLSSIAVELMVEMVRLIRSGD